MTTPGPQNPPGTPPDGGRPHSGPPTTPSDRRAGAAGVRSNVPLAVVGLVLGVLMSVLDQTIVTIALRDITTDLGGTGSAGWVVTAYVLASTATATLYGRLSDRYGRRAVYLAAVAAFTAASALCGLAQDMPQLVTARAIQGAGAGALFAVPAIALAELFPGRLRARVQGAVGAVFALAAVGGPLVGGALTEAAGWRWIFYVNVPIGLLSILLVATSLRLPRPQADPRLDVPGAILLAGAAVSLVLLTGRPDRYGLIALTAALFAAFWWRERRAESPIIPPRLFEERALRVVFPATALLGVLLYGSIVFLPTYLQVAFGLNATEAGLAGNP
ncbi:drug resistance transporter, EmrB/QacA subfamily [Nonomuraea solani]|uniref:Drug resistance transporter, EmrB/QacA subfamily n=1 Tax=Nonomuraea solani TaxID=1144553 RepID=A0A1H6ESC1_9ACTN|nr:MFS transporter [Nonomuraea solani]SEH00767.1 drug resistance transporter, EmrB/QacA subfamily [Nonomuraea solani]